jgi:uncharacterized damage-inducible protein DinB
MPAIEETTMTDRSFQRPNDQSRERLARLVETLTPAQLAVDVGGGWSVASALAHTGFWDRWQAERWGEMLAGKWSVPDDSVIAAEHLANEALHPYWAGIDGEDIPALALDAATKLDALIASAPDAVVDALDGTPSAYLLHRHRHRGEHLDQIERGLDAAEAASAQPSPHAAAQSPNAAIGASSWADRSYMARNQASLARLRELLGSLSGADLTLSSGEGSWTVGQTLGHLSFWDRFLAARWRAALTAGPGEQPGVFSHEMADLINGGLPPTWQAFASAAPEAAIAETLDAAEAIDGLIAGLPDATPVETILADRPALLDRSIHRAEHIETLEHALAARRR